MQRALALSLVMIGLCVSLTQAAPPKATVKVVLSSSPLSSGGRVAAAIVVDFPKGLHAQSHTPLDANLIPFVVTLKADPDISAAAPIYPTPKIETYPLLGKLSVYEDRAITYVIVTAPLVGPPNANGKQIKIAGSVRYQMCNDSECFAPVNLPFELDVPVVWEGSFQTETKDPYFSTFDFGLLSAPASQPAQVVSPATQSAGAGGETTSGPQSLIGAVALALVVGVIFNVMPCVLPVLPLKAVGFYESAGHDRGKTILYGVFFSAGMTSIFTALALAVVLSKSVFGHQIQWGEQFAHPGFVWPMAIVLIFLGVSMLGVFAVKLPTGIYGLNFRHDTLIGNFLWGGLTAVLATPCTAPLFPPLIGYAIAQPPLIGFTTMASVGIGMSLPYLILSAFPQLARKFPRTGPFAELFKQMMGFLLLGTAAWFVGIRLVPDPQQWWLVFGVVVLASVFLIVRTRQILPTPRAIIIAAALALLFTATGFGATLRLTSVPFKWQPYTPDSFAAAQKTNQTVLVEFTASWCLNCKYIEQTVYHDPRTLDALQKRNVITLKADLTDYSAAGWPLLTSLGGTGIPFTAIYSPANEKPATLESIYTTDTLLKTLDSSGEPATRAP